MALTYISTKRASILMHSDRHPRLFEKLESEWQRCGKLGAVKIEPVSFHSANSLRRSLTQPAPLRHLGKELRMLHQVHCKKPIHCNGGKVNHRSEEDRDMQESSLLGHPSPTSREHEGHKLKTIRSRNLTLRLCLLLA